MPKGIHAAASAMVVETRALEVAARNLANAQTSGWRKEVFLRGSFAEALAREGRTGSVKGDGGTGVLPAGGSFVFGEGNKDHTGGAYDLAIEGEGFFRVRDGQGRTLLTRSGQFTADSDGRLVDHRGWSLEGQGGPVTIPGDAARVTVERDGRVVVERAAEGRAIRETLDQIRLAAVDDPARLAPLNGQHFDPGNQPLRDAAGGIRQGWIERANVEPIAELAHMMTIQRRYDAAQKALREQAQVGQGLSDMLRGS